MSKKKEEKDYSLEENILSRPRSVREKCLDCMGQQYAEVRRCPIKHCPLWPWRLGNVKYTLKISKKDEAGKTEKKMLKICKICGEMGHNIRSCPKKRKE